MLERNKAALLALDIRPMAPSVPKALPVTPSKPKAPKKAKIVLPATPESPSTLGGRRSSRIKIAAERAIERAHVEFEVDDDDERFPSYEELGSDYDSEDDEPTRKRKRRQRVERIERDGAAPARLSGHRPNPKIFGHQRGVPVGTSWGFRMECSQAGVHAPVVAGIAGNEHVGAWSVALSGGYEDDVDVGYGFTFTGSGGRDLKGTSAAPKNLRTAPQTSDQVFTKLNAALKRSVETGKPVRVIRGFKGHSPWAPETGYRYDGLYVITKYWQDVGEAGFKVCKYAFQRMDGQPDIPVRLGREGEAEAIIKKFGKGANSSPPETAAEFRARATHSGSASPKEKKPMVVEPLTPKTTPSKVMFEVVVTARAKRALPSRRAQAVPVMV